MTLLGSCRPEVVTDARADGIRCLAANTHLGSPVVDWYPEETVGHIVAIGQPSGIVTVTGLGPGTPSLFAKRDLAPKSVRPCTQVAWNPIHHNLLAGETLAAYFLMLALCRCALIWCDPRLFFSWSREVQPRRIFTGVGRIGDCSEVRG